MTTRTFDTAARELSDALILRLLDQPAPVNVRCADCQHAQPHGMLQTYIECSKQRPTDTLCGPSVFYASYQRMCADFGDKRHKTPPQ